MSEAHVFSSSVTQKKIKIRKTFRHIEIMIFTTFFVNRFFRTRYEKKVNSRYNTQKNKSRIIEMFIESNKEI